MPEIRVRPYADADHDTVVALWRTVFPDAPARNDPVLDIARKQRTQPEFFLVAERAGGLAGAVMGGFDGHRGWVHLLAVQPGHQGAGVGEALLAHLERALDAAGCPKLNLQVRGDNRQVVAFYERLGYAVEDRVSMGKVLPSAPG